MTRWPGFIAKLNLPWLAWLSRLSVILSAGVSNPWPMGCMEPRMAMNVAQHKIVNLLKTLRDFLVITCCNVFHVRPMTTLLVPVWPKDAKSLDTPAKWKVTGSIPGQGSNLRCRPGPWLRHVWEATSLCFSHTSMFLSLSLSLPSLFLKINK